MLIVCRIDERVKNREKDRQVEIDNDEKKGERKKQECSSVKVVAGRIDAEFACAIPRNSASGKLRRGQ